MALLRSEAKLVSLAVAAGFLATSAFAQTDNSENISQVEEHIGEMVMPMEIVTDDAIGDERLRYEPYQMLNEFLRRDDIVFLMRHGPTDWSTRDAYGVGSTDCENQRLMTEEGQAQMVALGAYLTFFNLRPGEIVVSEWCRNQQTLAAMAVGMAAVDEEYARTVPISTDPNVNLLLSLNGAPNVTALRERILAWDGGDGTGPLLIISHFTNIAELTEFSIYEGEILVLDPDRDGRVLGYFRLASAGPDVGHFQGSDVDR